MCVLYYDDYPFVQAGVLKKTRYIWDMTDGCAKQYRCGNALYLLSLLAVEHEMRIDRMIQAPGHGKCKIDGYCACEKSFLKAKMCFVGTPEAEDSKLRMNVHTWLDGVKVSLARECQRLCADEARAHGATGGMMQKRQAERTMTARVFHIQDAEDTRYADLQMRAVGFEKVHASTCAHHSLTYCR